MVADDGSNLRKHRPGYPAFWMTLGQWTGRKGPKTLSAGDECGLGVDSHRCWHWWRSPWRLHGGNAQWVTCSGRCSGQRDPSAMHMLASMAVATPQKIRLPSRIRPDAGRTVVSRVARGTLPTAVPPEAARRSCSRSGRGGLRTSGVSSCGPNRHGRRPTATAGSTGR